MDESYLIELETNYSNWMMSHGFEVSSDIPKMVHAKLSNDNLPRLYKEIHRLFPNAIALVHGSIGLQLVPSHLVPSFLEHHKDEFWERYISLNKAYDNYREYHGLSRLSPNEFIPISDEEILNRVEKWKSLDVQMERFIDLLKDPLTFGTIVLFSISPIESIHTYLTWIIDEGLLEVILEFLEVWIYIPNISMHQARPHTLALIRALLNDLLEAFLGKEHYEMLIRELNI